MKRKILISLVFVLLCFTMEKSFSQTSPYLKVSQLSNFPVCPDTASQGDTTTIAFEVVNLDSTIATVMDSLFIIFRNDSATIPVDTVFRTYITTLQGEDTLNFTSSLYTFTSSRYKAGNNIIVVWPRIMNDSGATADSLDICVLFDPFASVSMISVIHESFLVFPNPVFDEIRLIYLNRNSIEYVRILNDIGQEVLVKRIFDNQIDVRFLSEGFYFIEIKERNGIVLRRKFLKL